MNNAFTLMINGFEIIFNLVASDNFSVAAPLAGAAISDEIISHGLRSRIKTATTTIVPDNNQEPIRVSFDSEKGIMFSYEPDQYTVFEPAILSGKSLPEFSLSDFYQALRTDDLDWKKILVPHATPLEAFRIADGKWKTSLIMTNKTQFRSTADPVLFQKWLMEWFKSGFPHLYSTNYWNNEEKRVADRQFAYKGQIYEYPHYYWLYRFPILPPVLKASKASDSFLMSFDFEDGNGFVGMRMDKLILPNSYGSPMKLYLPLTNWGGDLLHPETGYLLKSPLPGKQPLYNLRDIQAASSVVLCVSLDDAETLKKANVHQTDVAFTSFVCDPGCYDEVNVTPLDGKKLFILISNQSGRSIAEEYLTVNAVYEFLRTTFGDKEPITFVHREVKYPDVGCAKSVEDVLTAYKSYPPSVRKCELVSEQDFKRRVAAITAFQAQAWMTMGQNIEADLSENDRTKQMLLRPFLHRGNITTIHGPAKTGKTTIAMGFSALMVSGEPGRTFIKGAAITVPRDSKPGKVVYLAFDSNCANNTVKLKADAKETYGLDDEELANLIMIPMVGRGADFKANYHAIADEVRAAADKHGTNGRKLSLIVFDTLSPLGEPVSAMRAVEAFSAEFSQAAILTLLHDNVEGGPNGGGKDGGKIFGACTHVVKLEKEEDGVHFCFETSNDGILPFDAEGFTYKIVNKHGKMEMVDPVRNEDDARASVKQQLMDAGESAEECARQLGLASSALRAAVQRSTKESEGENGIG
jgi:hypothetical protein